MHTKRAAGATLGDTWDIRGTPGAVRTQRYYDKVTYSFAASARGR